MLQGGQPLGAPGIQQVATALEGALPFHRRRGAAKLQLGLTQRQPLDIGGLEQRREPGEEGGVVAIEHQAVAQQPGQIEISQLLAGVDAAIHLLEPAGPEVVLLDLADRGPELAVVLQGEVFEIEMPQIGPDSGAPGGAVEVKPQHLSLGPLSHPRLTRLLPARRAAMPALAPHLLAQIVLQLQGEAGLATGEALRHPLQVMAAHRRLRQLAEQFDQGRDRLLELIGSGQVTAGEHLLDLPVEPERGRLQQGAVVARAVGLEVVVGILAGREVKHAQLELALEGQLLRFADGPLGSAHTGAIAVEVEHQPLAVAATAELGDLLAAQGRSQGRHRMGDAGGMKGDDIEIAFHHHRLVGPADRVGGPVEAEEVLALLEHLRLR